tara:strand:- start:2652 stop:3692 length:1041 start_codon:yes stop_codon:yes gene_type:complete
MIQIGKRKIGVKHPPIIIAELGINHNGSLDFAIELADIAIKCGAEIIKHQTHLPECEMIKKEAKKIIPGNSTKNIFDIIQESSLSENDEKKLMKYIEDKKCIFISTPFSREAADRLNKFKVKAFKIGSGECNNYPLIEHICKFKKPIILSTGMNTIDSVKYAVKIIERKKIPYALLQCTNIYPTPPDLVRLNSMKELKKRFPKAVIGLSDHTKDNYCSYAALGLGASIIEKHFIDTKNRKGPDVSASMDTKNFKDLIEASKTIYASLKYNGPKKITKPEIVTSKFAFASVVSIKSLKKGEKFSKKNIWVKRPGTGEIPAKIFFSILGKRSKVDIPEGIYIKKKFIQ